MAASDATPFPVKNQAFRVTFPILDNDGDLVTGAAALDSEVSKDAGTFADCTNEATEIATSSGVYYLDLTATEMNADTVAIIVKTTTTDAKTTVMVLYPQTDGADRDVNVTHIGGSAVSTTSAQIGVNVVQISADATAADNAEAFFDGTGYAGTNNVIPTVTTLTGHTAQTGDSYARLGAPAGASIAADIATVDTVVDGIQTDLDNGTDGLGAIKTDTAAILADTGTDGVVIAAAQTVATVTDVTNQVSADVTAISGSTVAADNLEESTEAIITGTAQTGTLSTTVMTTDITGYLDDELIGRTVIWKSGTANGQASDITDYASASGTVTYTAITTAPANGDLFVIV